MQDKHINTIRDGYRIMNQSSIIICSIVRDCNKSLKKNIPVIEKIRSHFKSSNIIIFENDSIDGTLQTLEQWSRDCSSVNIQSINNNQPTIPEKCSNGVNKYYSYSRISKMSGFRNNYFKILNDSNIVSDFVLIIDLDIGKINIDGIAHSFGLSNHWDVVCANGYSYSPFLKKRYHDTYALVELGKEDEIQTEEIINENRAIWSFMKTGLPLIPVYSAYGGLSIYHYNVLKNKRYSVLKNNDKRVEVRCEHFSLCHEIRNSGFSRIYINPNMILKYQNISWSLIKKYLKDRLINKSKN